MGNEHYVSYSTIHKLVKKLADKIVATNYQADYIVAIGSGGFIPARILKTFLNIPILAVGVSYYGIDNKPLDVIEKIQWIDDAQKHLQGKRIILIDEVDDSRTTLLYCIDELIKSNLKEIAVLVLHNKDKKKAGEFPKEVSHYFAAQDLKNVWIKYPWDAIEIDKHNIKARS
ncbi:MAG: phosphoribosyltransferase [Candidatus Cloacimonetes bacterium]|jgi:hypoxanthine phosphoribosyltransferase|nr:phosphoribosyltransferase [Candidatus Cloacimonadota bacterium]